MIMAVRYNPNPVRTQEPLCQVNTWDEVETSSLYTVECNGQAQTVYHTDSFDYVIPVVRDDSPLQVTVQVHKPFEEAVGGYVIKPPGKPKLAEASDKREAYNPAAADFSGVSSDA